MYFSLYLHFNLLLMITENIPKNYFFNVNKSLAKNESTKKSPCIFLFLFFYQKRYWLGSVFGGTKLLIKQIVGKLPLIRVKLDLKALHLKTKLVGWYCKTVDITNCWWNKTVDLLNSWHIVLWKISHIHTV